MDSSVIHLLDLGDELSGVLGTDDSWEGLNALFIDFNLESSPGLESGSLLSLLLLGQLDLGLGSEEEGDFLALSSNVLHQNGDGFPSRAILGQNVVTVIRDLSIESVGNVVKGIDLVSFNGARGFGVDTESTVTDVVGHALGGSEGEEGLHESVGTDATEGEAGVGLGDRDINEFLVGSHMGLDTDLTLSSSFMETIVAHVWVEVGLGKVLNIIGAVTELNWQVLGEGDLKVSIIQSSGLMFSNPHADRGDGESLLFVFFTLLCLGGFLLGPFSHLWSAVKLSLNLDLVLHVLTGLTELELSLNLDREFLLEEDLAEDDEFMTVGVFGSIVFTFEFSTAILLELGVLGLNDGITDGLEGLRGLGKGSSSLVGSITSSSTDVEATR